MHHSTMQDPIADKASELVDLLYPIFDFTEIGKKSRPLLEDAVKECCECWKVRDGEFEVAEFLPECLDETVRSLWKRKKDHYEALGTESLYDERFRKLRLQQALEEHIQDAECWCKDNGYAPEDPDEAQKLYKALAEEVLYNHDSNISYWDNFAVAYEIFK